MYNFLSKHPKLKLVSRATLGQRIHATTLNNGEELRREQASCPRATLSRGEHISGGLKPTFHSSSFLKTLTLLTLSQQKFPASHLFCSEGSKPGTSLLSRMLVIDPERRMLLVDDGFITGFINVWYDARGEVNAVSINDIAITDNEQALKGHLTR
ncbi:hypothetical protein KQX54_000320 [Cotesia glomerata]|uniref:Uncharacterized protein n=1 Tax=Cotesia glomerata TaxID=32391 RepID=A0AAV7J0M1_COTGL|nr:hypothetical protein KQX54_000320 [Cotesia glomerata]